MDRRSWLGWVATWAVGLLGLPEEPAARQQYTTAESEAFRRKTEKALYEFGKKIGALRAVAIECGETDPARCKKCVALAGYSCSGAVM